jgi:hypothetical protein
MRAEPTGSAHRRPELRVESGGGHGGTAKMAWLVCGRQSGLIRLSVIFDLVNSVALEFFV